MKLVLILGAVVALAGCSSIPAGGVKVADEHAGHHPAEVASNDAMCSEHMKAMQGMQQKMMAAKTAEERAAMMKVHMKAMQEDMGMMGQMKPGMAMQNSGPPRMGGAMAAPDGAMKCRMDMMEMKMQVMMQMMMDRDTAKASPNP